MKVAFVVQRYGVEIVGGAEQGCRHLAELMSDTWDVSVITSCAKNYHTWANEYEPGTESINNIQVHRFPVAMERDIKDFSERSSAEEQRAYSLSPDEEADRFIRQGPYTPELVEYIEKSKNDYDIFIFYTYLYYSTVVGASKVAAKSYLVTTAHDEPPFYFVRTYAPLFHSLKGLIYLSPAEKHLVNRIYEIPPQVQQIESGIGVAPSVELTPLETSECLKKFQKILDVPYLLYLGRIAHAKGCKDLLRHFCAIQAAGNYPIKLVLAGSTEIDIPERGDVEYLGFVTEKEKAFLLSRSRALINPSSLESFSIVIMEAWRYSRPVIVNAASDVMREHCDQSGGGMYYYSPEMLRGIIEWLLANKDLATEFGKKGSEYVAKKYSWEQVKTNLIEAIGT